MTEPKYKRIFWAESHPDFFPEVLALVDDEGGDFNEVRERITFGFDRKQIAEKFDLSNFDLVVVGDVSPVAITHRDIRRFVESATPKTSPSDLGRRQYSPVHGSSRWFVSSKFNGRNGVVIFDDPKSAYHAFHEHVQRPRLGLPFYASGGGANRIEHFVRRGISLPYARGRQHSLFSTATETPFTFPGGKNLTLEEFERAFENWEKGIPIDFVQKYLLAEVEPIQVPEVEPHKPFWYPSSGSTSETYQGPTERPGVLFRCRGSGSGPVVQGRTPEEFYAGGDYYVDGPIEGEYYPLANPEFHCSSRDLSDGYVPDPRTLDDITSIYEDFIFGNPSKRIPRLEISQPYFGDTEPVDPEDAYFFGGETWLDHEYPSGCSSGWTDDDVPF